MDETPLILRLELFVKIRGEIFITVVRVDDDDVLSFCFFAFGYLDCRGESCGCRCSQKKSVCPGGFLGGFVGFFGLDVDDFVKGKTVVFVALDERRNQRVGDTTERKRSIDNVPGKVGAVRA